MANLIKIGGAALKSGSNVFGFNKSQSIGVLIGTVTGFSNLGFITVDTAGNRLFLGSSNGGTIYILNLTTYAVISTSLSGYAVAVDNANQLFVSDGTSTKVYNATTYALISTLAINSQFGIAFGYGKVYLRNSGALLSIIDSTTFATITSFSAATSSFSKGIRVDQINNRIFAFSWNEGLRVYNATTFAYIGISTVCGGYSSSGLAINNNTNRIIQPYTLCKITNLIQPFVGQLDSFTMTGVPIGIDADDTRIFICSATTLYIYSNTYS